MPDRRPTRNTLKPSRKHSRTAAKKGRGYSRGQPLYTRDQVARALMVEKGVKARAARLLEISEPAIYNYLKRWPSLKRVAAEAASLKPRKLLQDKEFRPPLTLPGVGGRPPKRIRDLELARRLARLQMTVGEMADVMDVSVDTLVREIERRPELARAIQQGRGLGRQSLRTWQMRLAKQLNPTMLVWLGKQYLNQREPRMEHVHRPGDGDGPSPFEDLRETLELVGRRAASEVYGEEVNDGQVDPAELDEEAS